MIRCLTAAAKSATKHDGRKVHRSCFLTQSTSRHCREKREDTQDGLRRQVQPLPAAGRSTLSGTRQTDATGILPGILVARHRRQAKPPTERIPFYTGKSHSTAKFMTAPRRWTDGAGSRWITITSAATTTFWHARMILRKKARPTLHPHEHHRHSGYADSTTKFYASAGCADGARDLLARRQRWC
jgi:hypothetical protein